MPITHTAYRKLAPSTTRKSGENPEFFVEIPAPRRKHRFEMTEALQRAVSLAKRFGLPLTHRNLYVIEKAVESESGFRQVSIAAAAANIREGALAAITRGESLNYFFFEDARWRPENVPLRRNVNAEREERLRMEALLGTQAYYTQQQCWRCLGHGIISTDPTFGAGCRWVPCPVCRPEASA
jgi:hypothetical protein